MSESPSGASVHLVQDDDAISDLPGQSPEADALRHSLARRIDPDRQILKPIQVSDAVAEQQSEREGCGLLESEDAIVHVLGQQRVVRGVHSNLSVGGVTTPTVEASAVPSRLGSLAWDGGPSLCDDCGWPECAAVDFCLKPFVSPIALLGLELTSLEAVQILDEIAAAPPKAVFLGMDLGPVEPTLATVSLTGAGESPVVELDVPAPARRDDGAPVSCMPAAFPPTAGTSC
ncbi:MAG: hypothetical protein ACT6SL_02590 [Brevundimonas aurantiaca]|uniref:hypothetical protein n=1 Tax=Brevundimonas aurantiaca TaxID=74316 RepID=UPI0040345056